MSRSWLPRPLVPVVLATLLAATGASAQDTLTGVIHMDGGYQHECAVRDTGEVACWGHNAEGELGDGTLVDRSLPAHVAIEGGIAIDVATGLYHTCILDGGGGVQCWGNNYGGQVGNGTTSFTEPNPQRVIGLDAGVSAIGAGSDHSCAVVDGGAKCWGFNAKGQLGTGVAGDPVTTPADVQGLSNGVTAISGSYQSTCAVVAGAAKCWGSNQYGTLGDGTNDDSLVPVGVVGLAHGVTRISLAGETACAVVDGAAKCWGDGVYGQLGNGWYAASNTPVDVIGLSANVTDIAVADYGACATTTIGMYCWGAAALGDFGPIEIAYEPVPVAFDDGDITAMGIGSAHSCAARNGVAHCWGDNHVGQLGVGAIPQGSLTPNPIPALAAPVDAVGSQYVCAISAGALDCWGDNSYGQLGDGSYNAQGSPVPVVGLGANVSSVAVGSGHTCAIVDGGAYCWGANGRGELGDGTRVTRPTPLVVEGLSSGVVAIAVGPTHSCAIVEGGTVKCWGEGDTGALGNDDPADQPLPVDVIGIASGATALALGSDYSCAIVDGGAKCWGDGGGGGTPWVPTDVVGLTSGVSAIVSESATTCAIANGGAFCWGYNAFGQVGDGTFDYRPTPVPVVGLDSGVLSIDVTYEHTCARTTGGVKCWGSNHYGELGTGATSDPVNVPVDAIVVPADASALGVGAYFGCIVRDGAMSCWGDGYSGSLGTGGVPSWAVPREVHGVDGLFGNGFDG